MNTMARSLLSQYYGVGSERHFEESFSSHAGAQTLEILPDEIGVATPKQLDEENDENATNNNQKGDVNSESCKVDTNNLHRDQRERSSRILNDDSSTKEDGDYDANYEIFFKTNEAMNEYVFKDEKSPRKREESSINPDKTQLLKPAEEFPDPNLIALEETAEARSNISSPMPKKRSSKKLRTSVMPLPPPPKKIPVYNEIFLDLTSTGISEFPLNMLDKLSGLKMLYLENNNLTELPDKLFPTLRFLNWLDVRNNRLTNLPSSIARHPSLETLLLQGNRIERLPLELCLVPNLKGLQTMRNPLVFPPKDVVSQGCKVILKYLREEWEKLYPEEAAKDKEGSNENREIDRQNGEVKPGLNTILCYKPSNSLLMKTTKKKKKKIIASDQLPEISSFTSTSSSTANTDERTVRQKSWDYKPSNRCSSEGANISTAMRLTWISKVKEMLGRQALALQRMKNKEALSDWRNDKSSFDKSIEKASKRTAEDIPFAVDLDNIPWISKQDLKLMQKSKTNGKGKRGIIPPTNINNKIEELFESLNRLQVTRQTESLSPRTEQKLLEIEIRKISNLQDEIQSLKRYNDVTVAPLMEGQYTPRKTVERPPPLII